MSREGDASLMQASITTCQEEGSLKMVEEEGSFETKR